MSVERKRRALELLEGALDQSREERKAFLEKECGDDPELRREVETLLDTDGGSGILAEPAFDVHAEDAGVGRAIGHYRLIELLDRGGMGAVYLAEREDFEQQVALKVIRRGLDLDADLVRRFENERQILARLEHPCVARLLDGGATEDGLPYFVMEYVEGEPIHRYCKRHGLSVEARLELFRKVCSAVQFAHQNLVIHRDLKPGNILITADGEPKLLDFGIAKLLDSDLAVSAFTTLPGRGPMTPRYASPEQIKLEPVTTASDVYTLGVLLYELLTGVDPYDVDTDRPDELARAILEREPDKPSVAVRKRAEQDTVSDPRQLKRRLAGDLDSIVLKAMRKEPKLRYASAEQLSDDVRRHLQGLPVDAQTGTFAYQAGKFVRRHKVPMTLIAAFALLLLGLGAVWRQADFERQRAESHRQGAQTAYEFLGNLFRGADPDQAEVKTLTVVELMQRAKSTVAELTQEPEMQVHVGGALGEVFRSLGAYDDAKEMMTLSLEAARQHYRGDHPEVLKRISNLAVLLYDHQDNAEAEALFREALDMGKRLRLPDRDLLRPQGNFAATLIRQGKLEDAEAVYREILKTREAMYPEPDDKDVATSRRSLAAVLFAQRRYGEAEDLLRKALGSRRRVHGDDHPLVASVLDLLGSVVAGQGREKEAEELYREALRVRLGRLGEDHPDVARTRKNLAALVARRDPEAAREILEPALETFRQDLPDSWEVAEAESVLGEVLAGLGLYAEAEPYLVGGFEKLRERRGEHDFRTRDALDRILRLYEAWGKEKELERYRALRVPEGTQ